MTDADLTIESSTVNERVYDRLCELLAQGRWSTGERIDERTLAKQLGVSRTPLREALGRLASEGVIIHRSYQGNFVRTFTRQQVRDLFEVRKSLECLAARLACAQINDHEVAQLRATVEECHRHLDEGNLSRFEAGDRLFHSQIVAIGRNDALAFSLRVLSLHIQLVRHLANTEPDLREETRVHRIAVVEAMEDRDADRAAASLERHIADVQNSVLRQLQPKEPAG